MLVVSTKHLFQLWLCCCSVTILLFYFGLDYSSRHDQVSDQQDVEVPVGTWDQARASPSAIPSTVTAPTPHNPPQNFSRTLVVARTRKESIDWIQHKLGDDPTLETVAYTVDDSSAEYTVPKNKGHEVMAYLTYIIDHYDVLRDITIFVHAHQTSWHNNDLLNTDMGDTIARLSSPRVSRLGYMNLRCHTWPGCPAHIHPAEIERSGKNPDSAAPEAPSLVQAWHELFPLSQMPEVLSQPCCSQFAVSRDRLLSLPKDQYEYFRNWLLSTRLRDYYSGRVWEYLWQYVFTGKYEVCPVEHECYCDGYGICFGGPEAYASYYSQVDRLTTINEALEELEAQPRPNTPQAVELQNQDEMNRLNPRVGSRERYVEERKEGLKRERQVLEAQLERLRTEASQRGMDPKIRAEEVGREWVEGDGF